MLFKSSKILTSKQNFLNIHPRDSKIQLVIPDSSLNCGILNINTETYLANYIFTRYLSPNVNISLKNKNSDTSAISILLYPRQLVDNRKVPLTC